jgi:hypothetical protein
MVCQVRRFRNFRFEFGSKPETKEGNMDTGDIHDRLTAIAAEAWLISAMTVPTDSVAPRPLRRAACQPAHKDVGQPFGD